MSAEEEPVGGSPTAAPANLADLLSRSAAVRPDATALVQPGPTRRSLSWAELDAQVTAVASGLASHGLVAGQRLVLRGANSIEFVVAYFASLRAGFVCVPVSPVLTETELDTVLRDSGARLLLSDTEVSSSVTSLALTPEGLAGLAAEASGPVLSPADREALAVLLYTAGTSDQPKAAMLSHRALLSHLEHFHRLDVLDDQTVVLAMLPLFHVFGLNAVLGAAVMAGATCVVANDTDDLLRLVVDEHVSLLPVASSLLYLLLQHENLTPELATVRTVVSGAAPLPASLATAFTERTGLRLEQGYGMTEAAPGVSVTIGSEASGPGYVGRPMPGVEVRIGSGRDETEPAEIWIRGDNLFSGYWPDGREGPGADGWFATGDIGYLSGEDLFLVDRARELIVVNGFNVYPAEVENVIRALSGVDLVAVIGQPDARTGQQVLAFVTGSGLTPAAVLEHCSTRMARFKQPARVQVLESLPQGATGKVKKGELRQLVKDSGELAQVANGTSG